jgi:prepilin-type processing-associated H-X9-DG protein
MTQLYSAWSLENLSKGNYAANYGADNYNSFLTVSRAGAFGPIVLRGWNGGTGTNYRGSWKRGAGEGVKINDILDGTSNTVVVSEVISPIDDVEEGRGLWACPAMGSSVFSAQTTPNSKTIDVIPVCGPGNIPIAKLKCTLQRTDGNVFAAARSWHPGGVNGLRADGSCRYYTDSISPLVWQAIATRAGGETLNAN